MIQAVRALAVTLCTSKQLLWFSNKYNCFHSGNFKSVETVYKMQYFVLSEELDIGRSDFGNFGFPSHKHVTWIPNRHFNVLGCSNWLKESGRNDWTNSVYCEYTIKKDIGLAKIRRPFHFKWCYINVILYSDNHLWLYILHCRVEKKSFPVIYNIKLLHVLIYVNLKKKVQK